MSDGKRSCVLLADRHHGLSDGIRGLLETVFEAVFMVADGTSLMEGARWLRPAVIVVDLAFAEGDIDRLLREVAECAPDSRVILLSVHDEPTVSAAAWRAGADAMVLKRSIATELLPAVDSLLRGRRYLGRSS